ncbi:hypothetical protein HF329_13090 [Chitinophaga oryzae]|uniref:Uncharacterized protein n=1 Tax=Chitinophaga oryzae TaxID=2725414 RepID=A0AAE6ZIS6_9BACT|nr:hypothetical protein [Chitinophaga oryzae]QJB32209.1 hypothetical protein HF329_13090 [Chitinophaga oryzae]
MEKKKVRDLIKPQRPELTLKGSSEYRNLVVPYCSSGYSKTSSGVTCSSGYSDNLWCNNKPADNDEVLF